MKNYFDIEIEIEKIIAQLLVRSCTRTYTQHIRTHTNTKFDSLMRSHLGGGPFVVALAQALVLRVRENLYNATSITTRSFVYFTTVQRGFIRRTSRGLENFYKTPETVVHRFFPVLQFRCCRTFMFTLARAGTTRHTKPIRENQN